MYNYFVKELLELCYQSEIEGKANERSCMKDWI